MVACLHFGQRPADGVLEHAQRFRERGPVLSDELSDFVRHHVDVIELLSQTLEQLTVTQ
jgi:hypothetical protein